MGVDTLSKGSCGSNDLHAGKRFQRSHIHILKALVSETIIVINQWIVLRQTRKVLYCNSATQTLNPSRRLLVRFIF